MSYGGFERDRNTLKFRCPARARGAECKGMQQCPVGTAVRIPLSEDRRVFTPVARSSYAWKDHYDQRSAVERVNSRLAGSFGFDDPFIRGLAKMRLRCMETGKVSDPPSAFIATPGRHRKRPPGRHS